MDVPPSLEETKGLDVDHDVTSPKATRLRGATSLKGPLLSPPRSWTDIPPTSTRLSSPNRARHPGRRVVDSEVKGRKRNEGIRRPWDRRSAGEGKKKGPQRRNWISRLIHPERRSCRIHPDRRRVRDGPESPIPYSVEKCRVESSGTTVVPRLRRLDGERR